MVAWLCTAVSPRISSLWWIPHLADHRKTWNVLCAPGSLSRKLALPVTIALAAREYRPLRGRPLSLRVAAAVVVSVATVTCNAISVSAPDTLTLAPFGSGVAFMAARL